MLKRRWQLNAISILLSAHVAFLPITAQAAAGNLTWDALSTGTYYFMDVAISDDGSKIIGVTNSSHEKLMYSSNGGVTFTNIAPARGTGTAASFSSVAIAGDGSLAYVTVENGGPGSGSYVYRTTNFSTWTQLSFGDNSVYRTVSTNTDGSRVVIGNMNNIKVSDNSGNTFPTTVAVGVFGCDMSNSGQKMVCFGDSNTLRVSTDYGATWTARAPSGTRFLFEDSVAISGDGTTMYAIWSDWGGTLEGKSQVYKSTNDGGAWTNITANLPEASANANSGYRNYAVVDTNNSGSVVLIGSRGNSIIGVGYQTGPLYLSDDSGATWTKQTNSSSTYWSSVAMNSTGSKLIGAIGLSGIITGTLYGSGISFVSSSTFNSLGVSGGNTVLTYRTPSQISANVSAAGRVTFLANGKRIGGCIQRPTSGTTPNIVATCNYSPTKKGAVRITAVLDPTDALITNSTSSPVTFTVAARTTNR